MVHMRDASDGEDEKKHRQINNQHQLRLPI
jgi:hypothetical protein